MKDNSRSSKLTLLVKKCRQYLKDSLEFWAGPGYDHDFGGYIEAMSLEGEPLRDLNRRLRVQGRNIFSHAVGTVHGYGDFTKVAEGGFDFVQKYFYQDGGYATLIDSQGKIVDDGVYAYDHAFLLLSMAWLASLTEKKEHRQGLNRVWEVFQNRFKNSQGGILTSVPQPKGPLIEQNPHMHLFEALMDVHILTKEEMWLKEAGKIYQLYRNYFYSPSDGLLREFFNEDYTPYTEKEWVDPGHHYEWTWLLNKYQGLTEEKVEFLNEIFTYAETRGCSKSGLAYEFLLPDGQIVKPTHRMWSQTEQIKARLAMYERGGNFAYLDTAMESVETLFRVFCHPDLPGVWYDCLDDKGNLVSDKSPGSTLYHLYIGLQEFIRVGEKTLQTSS